MPSLFSGVSRVTDALAADDGVEIVAFGALADDHVAGAVRHALHAQEDGLDVRGRNPLHGPALQQRGHPVIALGALELGLQVGHFVGAGLVPGDHHIEQFAVDGEVFHVVHGARGDLARQLAGQRIARLGRAALDHADGALVLAQLDGAGNDPDGALLGVTLLEEQAAGIHFPNENLAGQGGLVFLLHAIERRKLSQQRHVDWASLTHALAAPGMRGKPDELSTNGNTRLRARTNPDRAQNVNHVAASDVRAAPSRCCRTFGPGPVAVGRHETARILRRRSRPHRPGPHRPRCASRRQATLSLTKVSIRRSVRSALHRILGHLLLLRLAVDPLVVALAALASQGLRRQQRLRVASVEPAAIA